MGIAIQIIRSPHGCVIHIVAFVVKCFSTFVFAMAIYTYFFSWTHQRWLFQQRCVIFIVVVVRQYSFL
jgi:hypothetical protein